MVFEKNCQGAGGVIKFRDVGLIVCEKKKEAIVGGGVLEFYEVWDIGKGRSGIFKLKFLLQKFQF